VRPLILPQEGVAESGLQQFTVNKEKKKNIAVFVQQEASENSLRIIHGFPKQLRLTFKTCLQGD